MNDKKHFQGLTPLKAQPKKRTIFGFDIETADNNKSFVCASIVGKDYVKFFTEKEALKEEFLKNQKFRNAYMVATNLMFDFFGIFGIAEAVRDFFIIERAGSLLMCKTYIPYKYDGKFYHQDQVQQMKAEGKIESIAKHFYILYFTDSGNFLRTRLEVLGKIVGIPKLEPPACLGEHPLGYEEWREMKRYNINDSLVTYTFMEFLQKHLNELGATLKFTVSSSALDLFRRKYLKDYWKQPKEETLQDSYKAYYGGRTEVFQRGLFKKENYGKLLSYDVNSLYPYCLQKFSYPHPCTTYKKAQLSVEDILNFEGFGYVVIKTNDDLIPILPHKTDKLYFPNGTLSGWYDFVSIRYALSKGYEILETGEGWVFENKHKPFKHMIDSLYSLRNKFKAEQNNAEVVVKLMMNSFYGKLAYQYKNKEFLVTKEQAMDYFLDDDVSVFPTNDDEIFRCNVQQPKKIPSYVFPMIPLYVTAYARIVMHQHFSKIGHEHILYSDTDCIFTYKHIGTSKDLGGLKEEQNFSELLLVKPKFYGGISNNEEVIKIKGMYKNSFEYEAFKTMVDKGEVVAKQLHFRKLRGALQKKDYYVNETFEQLKSMSTEDSKRIWEKDHFTLSPQTSVPLIQHTNI